jgi:hypothetical protein
VAERFPAAETVDAVHERCNLNMQIVQALEAKIPDLVVVNL